MKAVLVILFCGIFVFANGQLSTITEYPQTSPYFGSTSSPGPTEAPVSPASLSPGGSTDSYATVSDAYSPIQTDSPTAAPTIPEPTPTQNTGPTTCYGLIFAGEMSRSITAQQKQDFLTVVLQIAGNFQNTNLKFAITTFGSTIYQYLGDFQDYNQFVANVNGLIAALPNPNSALTYIAPVMDDIYDELVLYNGKGISTLFMGEMEAIRDPNAGHTAVMRVAGTGKNVYVLDYSTGVIPTSLWNPLTGNHPERIINGTGSDATSIYNKFYNTLVIDIFNNNC